MIKEKIIELLEDQGIALSIFDLKERINADIMEVQTALNELCEEGRTAITKKGKYALPEILGLIPAKASATRSGAPIAIPMDGSPSMKMHCPGRARCLPEDLLLVRKLGADECELASITRRGKREIPAFIRIEVREIRMPKQKHARHGRRTPPEKRKIISAVACDRRIPYPISILPGDIAVRNDEIALISIDEYPEGDRPMTARIVRVIGDKSDMRARLKIIAENHAFSSVSNRETQHQAKSFSLELSEGDLAGREDLRNLTVFTIDGPFSKDFDDAVSLERTEDGDWRLGVHIADVSHYVLPGSPIDREAFERGTSLYLPGVTVPMLPEVLSNNLCSLVPDEDRLALSLFMIIRNGKVIDHHLCASVIHSCARLTYDGVNRLFGGDGGGVPEALHGVLHEMLQLSHDLRARRFSKGCIELDLPETDFVLDEENVPVDICASERGESERLIEDFMLAANETIAALARNTHTPLVYRIHEAPDSDRISTLERYLASVNVTAHLGASPHPRQFQQIVEKTQDHPSADSIRRMLLRSMQRAQYAEQPAGHYALALEDYCHFTSPIRRYPDLIVHRMMKQLLAGQTDPRAEARMAELSKQCSAREQEATLAEREADDLMKARYMQDRIGRRYSGTISGITGWGMYVTLDNSVEGLVHIATLDDYYEFDRDRNQLVASGSRNVFRLGDRVRIRVEYVDLDRAEIDFSLVSYERDRRTDIRP